MMEFALFTTVLWAPSSEDWSKASYTFGGHNIIYVVALRPRLSSSGKNDVPFLQGPFCVKGCSGTVECSHFTTVLSIRHARRDERVAAPLLQTFFCRFSFAVFSAAIFQQSFLQSFNRDFNSKITFADLFCRFSFAVFSAAIFQQSFL